MCAVKRSEKREKHRNIRRNPSVSMLFHFLCHRLSGVFRNRNGRDKRHTTASVTGRQSQIPVNPKRADKIHAAGIISAKPLKTEIRKASFGLSQELKKADEIMLIPEKKRLIK